MPFFYAEPAGHWKCGQRLRLCLALAWVACCHEQAGSPGSTLRADPWPGGAVRGSWGASCGGKQPPNGALRLRVPCSLQPPFYSEQEFPLLLHPGQGPPAVNNVLTLTKCCFGTGVNCNLYSAALGAGKRTHPNGSQLAELGCSALDHMLPAQRGLVSTGARAHTRVCVCVHAHGVLVCLHTCTCAPLCTCLWSVCARIPV